MTRRETAQTHHGGTDRNIDVYKRQIVVLVMNNRVLGMVRQWQKVFYGRRFSATDPHRKTDLVKLAEAFGCTGMRIARTGDIEPVLRAALAAGGPVVVDLSLIHI